MHVFITGVKGIDHEDGDGLNNQRLNLRQANQHQNNCNRGKQSNNTSGFKGVVRSKNRWQAMIQGHGKTIHGGRFTDKIEAAARYNELALQYHGEFAQLNELPATQMAA